MIFNSTNEANVEYQALKNDISFSYEDMGLGDESIGIQYPTTYKIIFRKDNVLVTLESYEEFTYFDLDDLKDYAEIVETRIG